MSLLLLIFYFMMYVEQSSLPVVLSYRCRGSLVADKEESHTASRGCCSFMPPDGHFSPLSAAVGREMGGKGEEIC